MSRGGDDDDRTARAAARGRPTRRRLPGRTHDAAELIALASRPRRRRRDPVAATPGVDALREAIGSLDGTVMGIVDRGRAGSLADRDPEFIERQLRWLGPVSDLWFRGEVRHLDRIAAAGPMLCVGNHSGGLLTPDTWVFMTHWFRHFGLQRPAYALAHNVVLGLPGVGSWLRRVGTLPADPGNAQAALEQGAAVLVYPGGDEDVFRPWSQRNRIQLAGRTGFVRLALQQRVPLVPVVSVGGHETVLILSDGRALARALRLDRFRIKALPVVVGPPWGVSLLDAGLHIPLPAKITVEVGEPIDFHREYGELDARDPEVIRACYRLVELRMQTTLDRLAAERRHLVLG